LLEDNVVYFQSTAAHTLDDILRRTNRTGHQVHLGFEANT
jgi:hypothetical protein